MGAREADPAESTSEGERSESDSHGAATPEARLYTRSFDHGSCRDLLDPGVFFC